MYADATGAKGALGTAKEVAGVGIVKVDIVGVGDHKFHLPEGILGAGLLH